MKVIFDVNEEDVIALSATFGGLVCRDVTDKVHRNRRLNMTAGLSIGMKGSLLIMILQQIFIDLGNEKRHQGIAYEGSAQRGTHESIDLGAVILSGGE
jgi:mannose/fructose-specific phosphotransferase system component IIA